MNKLTLGIIAFLLIISSALAIELNSSSQSPNVTASISQATLDVSSLRYEPFPAEPGDYITMWFTVKNLGSNPAYDVPVEIVEEYPFSVDGDNVRVIERIAAGQEYLFKIEKIRIDENAIEGENQLTIRYPGPYNTIVNKEISISVRSVLPSIQTNITTSPSPIPQGQIATVNVSVTNTDTSAIRDVTIKFELPEGLVAIGSIPEQKIQRLQPRQTETAQFQVMAAADAEGRAYKTPIVITFSDETGTLNTKNQTIGLLVGEDISYDLNIEESAAFTSNKQGTLVLSVANTGPNEIKFLTVTIQPDEDYRVLSNNKIYLGNLDPDDFETSEFTIATRVQKEGNNCWIPFTCSTPETTPLNITLEYRDSYNNLYQDNQQLTIPIYSSQEVAAYGLGGEGGIGIVTILIGILLVIFLYLTYTHWRKEKHLPKAMKGAFKQEVRGIGKLLSNLRWRNLKRAPRRIKRFFTEP